jgi:uncharacterized Tic20 family protein
MRGGMDNATPPPSTPPVFQPTPPPADPNAERTWAMWCHMSALGGLAFPAFGALVGTLLVWQMKRNEFPSVEEHGKESFNFQLSVLIYLLIGGAIAFVGMFFCIGWLLFPLLAAAHYGAIILGIIGGTKANDGVMYRYPFNLRLVK